MKRRSVKEKVLTGTAKTLMKISPPEAGGRIFCGGFFYQPQRPTKKSSDNSK